MLGLVLAISSKETYREMDQIATPQVLANDKIFEKTILTSELMLKKFNASGALNDELKLKRISYLASNLSRESGYEELVNLMGYRDTFEFEAINQPYFENIQKLTKRYGQTLDTKILKLAAHEYKIKENSKSHDNIQEYLMRSSGCKGGAACLRQYSDCVKDAEDDFAADSWGCSTMGWIPVGWAACQGTTNLLYAASMSECLTNVTKCCGTYFQK
jgi:hypothetical protein